MLLGERAPVRSGADRPQQTVGAEHRHRVRFRLREIARDDGVNEREGLHECRHMLGALDEVITHLGPHRSGKITQLQLEGSRLELRQHRTPAEHAEIAALVLGGGVVGEPCRKGVERFAGADARQQRIRAHPCRAVARSGRGDRRDQDVLRAHQLLRRVLIDIAPVPALDLRPRQLDVEQRRIAQDHAREVHDLAAPETHRVGVEQSPCTRLVASAILGVERHPQRGFDLLEPRRVRSHLAGDQPDEEPASIWRDARTSGLAALPDRVADRSGGETGIEIGAHGRRPGLAHAQRRLQRWRSLPRVPCLVEVVRPRPRLHEACVPTPA